jgi:diguanylate cyclase (GGDEF)-like protein
MLLYPTIYFISYLGLLTIQSFIGKKLPRFIDFLAYVFLVVNVGMAVTNPLHQAYRTILPSEVTTREVLFNAGSGWFFYLHTAISYVIILTIVLKLLIHLNRVKSKTTIVPFYLVLVSVIIGAILNVVHVFVYTFYIDPTYLFFVYFTYVLYMIIFQRDFRLSLIRTSRKVLINSMREMYIIASDEGEIIEYSSDLNNYFDLNQEAFKSVNTLLETLKSQAELYVTFDLIKDAPYNESKRYFYYTQKPIHLKHFKAEGTLILLYEETRLMQLVDNLNFMRSHDQMTKLYNRNYFEENKSSLEKTYASLGVLVLDLDGLKLTNDYLGHKAGDELIIRFAKALKALSETQTNLRLIRFGGDEFLIIDESSSLNRLIELKKAIQSSVSSDDLAKHISVSIGYALRAHNEDIEKTIKRADDLLYQEKERMTKTYQEAYKAYLEKK